jgi:hypothetical protein
LAGTTLGGQAICSDLAIETVLVLRLVFPLARRKAEAFASSVFRVLGLDLALPVTLHSADVAVILLGGERM